MLSQYHRDLHSILKFSEDAGYNKIGDVIHYYHTNDENDTSEFNQRTLQFGYALNKDFVAGARKDELEALIPFLPKFRRFLPYTRS